MDPIVNQTSVGMNPPAPMYLEPFLDGSPLAVERIKLAWPALSMSDRVTLIATLLADSSQEKRALRYAHHQHQILDLALSDEGGYIRYAAAKYISPPSKREADKGTAIYGAAKARFERVQADSASLVRLASEEVGLFKGILTGELDDPISFWKRPQPERLVLVSGVVFSGEKIANLLRWGTKEMLPSGPVPPEEMVDVLLQYTSGRSLTERVAEREITTRFDGHGAYDLGKNIEALWKVIPELPASLSCILIKCLPEKAGLFREVPAEIIASFNKNQLEELLYRKDFSASGLRRKLYKESTDDDIKCAALVNQSCVLIDSDISELIYSATEQAESAKNKIKGLVMLAGYSGGATLAQLEAIRVLIRSAPSELCADLSALQWCEGKQTARAKKLSPTRLMEEIFEMRVFSLANNIAPISESKSLLGPQDRLKDHGDQVVAYNPWQTYLNLRKIVFYNEERRWNLPNVEIRDFQFPIASDENEKTEVDRGRQLLELLEQVQIHVKDGAATSRAEFAKLITTLEALYKDDASTRHAGFSSMSYTLSQILRDIEIENRKRAEIAETRFRNLSIKINIIVWFVLAIGTFAFFKLS